MVKKEAQEGPGRSGALQTQVNLSPPVRNPILAIETILHLILFTFLGHTFKESYDTVFGCWAVLYDESLSRVAHVLTVHLLAAQSGSIGMEVTGRDGVLESIHEIRSQEVNCWAEVVHGPAAATSVA